MLRCSKNEIERRAQAIVAEVESTSRRKLKLELINGDSVIGGGAAPSAVLPTSLIALTHSDLSADDLNVRLRSNVPPIVARVEDGRVLLDLRTVFAEQDTNLVAALASLAGE
jgi:L-seryl-tRNA(Ser) seleniumtransferase